MDVSIESTFKEWIGGEMMDTLRVAELMRQSALEARVGGMRASANGDWATAVDLYGKSLMLFRAVGGINVEEDVNLGVVLLVCLYERLDILLAGGAWQIIESLYAEAKQLNSQYCGDIAHFVFALRVKYGDLDGAGIALSEREEFGIPVDALDWDVLDSEYTRSLLDLRQA